jgi:CheY-like chemotaxis protein
LDTLTQIPDPSPQTIKVLVVEDDVFVRLMLADDLRDEGFQVFETADPGEAISILRTTPVDVVITDLHRRAAKDGILVATYVRGHLSGTSLVLTSAHTPTPTEGSLFDAFFTKPYKPEDIAIWIKRRPTTS